MSKAEPSFNFHYGHILPKKPSIAPFEATELTKQCRRCGAAFRTKSRIRKRCDVCQAIAAAATQERSYAKQKERRKASRNAR